MDKTWTYAGVTGVAVVASGIMASLGLGLAVEAFRPLAQAHVSSRSDTDPHRQSESLFPSSPLIGTKPAEAPAVADAGPQGDRDAEWVEVVDAVNMRSGGSSSNPVIKVQLEGMRLRVVSRERGWVEVVEPETELTGWVYEQYVFPTEPESKQAGLVDAER